ncbi:Cytochrome oxidase maturation protein cbb3-type [Pelagimonas phthalicica]|uniref:Cytochrome oxidase maturation protein cbb3-type n=1 Tax=Pelagimonas phthalicica TaxID=1037362 RepID=A0A238JF49_9RHOB|nr:cbb3-type cytochrome oxidase assembly protein CcoS [Pelagimonas phthalicica]TDS92250.1 cbb3-type cytochrome oxidase maturation protein [Pelagimonas phthalicica]SMX29311.1 Cytochrome oxidase maturation protein cbb3-type [Pelagimonas phthalicica]
MLSLLYLIPASLILALAALAGFYWTLKTDQYGDPDGDSHRILGAEDKPLR